MKYKILLTFAVLVFNAKAQTLNPTVSIQAANTANNFTGGYTFAYATSGTPWNGSLISFGGFSNNYDTQINADYGPNGGNHISFRTNNGDAGGAGIWNPWVELATKGINTFSGQQTVNGSIISSIASNEGGTISLENPLKTGNAANIWRIYNMTANYGNSLQFWSYSENGNGSGSKMTLSDNGNVGIGTANPLSKLDLGNNYSDPSTSPNKISLWNGGSNNYFGLGISNASFDYFSQGQHRFFVGYNGVPGREVFTVKESGNAALQGKFEAKEIKVTTTPTADFVFANDYKLPTLE
ncbi:MAG TPA: hypothetical protein VF677_08425, partial [Flavobacterium sp.]